jgi:hypothetical protein
MGNLFDKEDFGADELEPEPESDEVQVTEDGAAAGAGSGTMEGFLVKQGHVIKNWKKRWCYSPSPSTSPTHSPQRLPTSARARLTQPHDIAVVGAWEGLCWSGPSSSTTRTQETRRRGGWCGATK